MGFFYSASTIQTKVFQGAIQIQCNRVDLLVSFQRFNAVSTTTIDFSQNSILSDRQGKQITTLSAAAG